MTIKIIPCRDYSSELFAKLQTSGQPPTRVRDWHRRCSYSRKANF